MAALLSLSLLLCASALARDAMSGRRGGDEESSSRRDDERWSMEQQRTASTTRLLAVAGLEAWNLKGSPARRGRPVVQRRTRLGRRLVCHGPRQGCSTRPSRPVFPGFHVRSFAAGRALSYAADSRMSLPRRSSRIPPNLELSRTGEGHGT